MIMRIMSEIFVFILCYCLSLSADCEEWVYIMKISEVITSKGGQCVVAG